MDEENLDKGRAPAEDQTLEDLLRAEAPAAAPDFDPKDEDVFDLELDPDLTAGLFACEPEEYADLLAERVADDKATVDWRNVPRFVMDSGRFPAMRSASAIPVAKVARPRTWPERALVGLLAANVLLLGGLLVAPEILGDPVGVESSALKVGPEQAAAAVAASLPGTDPTSGRERHDEPVTPDIDALPDRERYESAQHWIGRGYYEKAASMLSEYVAAHPAATLLQRQAVFSSLLYCAQRLGDTSGATAHAAQLESLRRLAASPEDLWAEASAARARSRGAKMRPLYARLLLQADHLAKRWDGTGRLDTARAAFGDSYRFEARGASERRKPVKGVRVIR